jgi:hypothetical protein
LVILTVSNHRFFFALQALMALLSPAPAKSLPPLRRLPYLVCLKKKGAMPNPVFQFQILSQSSDETAAFYTQLFGWSVDANNPLNYRRIDTRSAEGIQGGI